MSAAMKPPAQSPASRSQVYLPNDFSMIAFGFLNLSGCVEAMRMRLR
jgi:hypothetical protein